MNRTTLLSTYIYIYIWFFLIDKIKSSQVYLLHISSLKYILVLIQPQILRNEKKKSFFLFFFGTLKMATTFWGNLHRLCFHYACYCVYLWNNRKKWPVIASILGLSWNFRFRVASISGPFSLTLPLINKE